MKRQTPPWTMRATVCRHRRRHRGGLENKHPLQRRHRPHAVARESDAHLSKGGFGVRRHGCRRLPETVWGRIAQLVWCSPAPCGGTQTPANLRKKKVPLPKPSLRCWPPVDVVSWSMPPTPKRYGDLPRIESCESLPRSCAGSTRDAESFVSHPPTFSAVR